MVFELSEKTRRYREQVEAFMDELIYPNEAKYHEQLEASGKPVVRTPGHGGAQRGGEGERAVEPLSA